MARVTISSGICGFYTSVYANKNEDEMVDVTVKTTCPNYKHMEGQVFEFNPFTTCLGKVGEGEVYEMFRECCPHVSCPVPSGMLKAIEVGAGFALPKDATMKIEK